MTPGGWMFELDSARSEKDLMSVMIGNGDATFEPSREIVVGRGMSEIAVGDYDRDGFKDLAKRG